MRGMRQLLHLEPRHVLRTPRQDLLRPADIELKEKLPEPIAMTKLVTLGSVARTNEVPQRLLLCIGDPDRREIPTPMKPRELFGVATVRLYSVSRLHRNERRRDHLALHPHLRKLPVQAVPAWPSLVA